MYSGNKMKRFYYSFHLSALLLSNAAAQEEIKFAMEATYAPFEYMDENKQIQGFDVDLANTL